METEIVKQTPAEMIMAAVTANTDLDKLKGLLDLQIQWEANEARKEFAKAFANAQANILPVVKKKLNKQTNSKYEDLADIIEITQPIYTREGFSVTFNEGDSPKDNHARITADVLHRLGHKEQYRLDIPLDGVGIKGNANMTAIHGKASAMQYGRRYLMRMIWNIPTSDSDGKISEQPVINEKQLHGLRDQLIAKELPEGKLCEFLKIETLEECKATDYMKASQAINVAKKVVK